MADTPEPRWLLLFHQVPPKPAYFRVKIWRRLQRLGAVALKNTVYALPRTPEAQEDFQWVLREIVAGGGDATLCEARLVEGLSDGEVEARFHEARDADYSALADDVRALSTRLPRRGKLGDGARSELVAELTELERRLAAVVAIDFFAASGRETVVGLLGALSARLGDPPPTTATVAPGDVRGRIWVTRQGVAVDRIASAWLIRRFIDPDARFRTVAGRGHRPGPGELRFDMFDAEFTHEGDLCTFEVLIRRFGLRDPGLGPIAEIVHDIDLKDGKFGRVEAPGVARLLAGLAMRYADDEARLERGAEVFEDLHRYFQKRGRNEP